MSTKELLLVQFEHPGVEHSYDKNNENIKSWNTTNSKHARKFIESKGDYVCNDRLIRNKNIYFWGEWEPASKVRPLNYLKSKDYPEFIHMPIMDELFDGNFINKIKNPQNTDPFVYNGNILYSNCHQNDRKNSDSCLKHLKTNSIILFGSSYKQKKGFFIDTVFVVNSEPIRYSLKEQAVKIKKEMNLNEKQFTLFNNVVLNPLKKNSKGCNNSFNDLVQQFAIYKGAGYEEKKGKMYSFFPCSDNESGFERPKISKYDLIEWTAKPITDSDLRKISKIVIKEGCENKIWDKLKKIVTDSTDRSGKHLKLGLTAILL